MSNSEIESQSSVEIPTDERLEKGLRDTVAGIFRSGNTDELTVKRVRLATEQALDLEEGFYKSHDTWKAKSGEVIREEVEAHEQLEQEKEQQQSPVAKVKRRQATKANPTKRTTADTSQSSRKKRKKDPTPEPQDDISDSPSGKDEEGDVKGSGSRMRQRSTSAKEINEEDSEASQVVESYSDTSDGDEPKKIEKAQPEEPVHEEDNAGSESEMSVLVDEEPALPKKQRQKPSQPTQGKKQKTPARKRKEESPADPDQAEIKRLQGWLVKCGVRKMWYRELAPYETPKAKIKHLKQMLAEAGMEGRYSTEKANRIREERELRADLEFVQEGARKWGTVESEDEGRPRRRLARGFKNLDFLGDDGAEESD